MKYLLILMFLFFTIDSNAQCKLRFINKTDSVLQINMTRLNLSFEISAHDTTKYYNVDSILRAEPYLLTVGSDRYESAKGKKDLFMSKGLWEMSFHWSERSQSWKSMLNQNE